MADPAAIPGDGLGCLLGPRSGAGTAGLRAVPEIMVPVNALAPDSQRREIRKVFLILRQLHEVTIRQVPIF